MWGGVEDEGSVCMADEGGKGKRARGQVEINGVVLCGKK